MIARLIHASLRRPIAVVAVVATASALAAITLPQLSLDALPDLSDDQVIVSIEWPGASPDLVEAQVTRPVSSSLRSIDHVRYVRGVSMQSDAFVYVVLDEGSSPRDARSLVSQRLSALADRLPTGARVTLGPDANSLGWVYEYALVDSSGKRDLGELRALQDWMLRDWLQGVDGVAEVASIGGFIRQYQVQLDPERLAQSGLTASDVVTALRSAGRDVGGGVLEIAGGEFAIRGRGAVRRSEDLEDLLVASASPGKFMTLGQVANVVLGAEPRRGVAELNGHGEVAGGIVIMRQGQNALRVAERVRERLRDAERALPTGVHVVTTYDRSVLVRRAVNTLIRTLLKEALAVTLVVALFLGSIRSAMIPILALGIGVLLALSAMKLLGFTADVMSLGGIAVAIGAMVDSSIVMIENVHRRLGGTSAAPTERTDESLASALEQVGRPLFFALAVLTVSFLPVLLLQGEEGRLFRPLAMTKTLAMAFAALLGVSLTPALSSIVLRDHARRSVEPGWLRALSRQYARVVVASLRRPGVVLVVAAASLLATLPALFSLGREFMPTFDEGTLLFMPTAPPGLSDRQVSRIMTEQDRRLMQFPEVRTVFAKAGRAGTATDPAPLSMIETVIELKPRSDWRRGMTWQRLVREFDDRVRTPGMANSWSMPIQTRYQMLATGVRTPIGIKVLGPDAVANDSVVSRLESICRALPGVRSAFAQRASQGQFIDLEYRRAALARHGLRAGDLSDWVETLLGGQTLAETYRDRERVTIAARFGPSARLDARSLEDLRVRCPDGAVVRLEELADVVVREGAGMLASEDGSLLSLVSLDVDPADLVRVYQRARHDVEARIVLPMNTRLVWSGQIEDYERARARMLWIVPLTLLLVAGILQINLRRRSDTAIVLLAVPFSLLGAVWLLRWLGYPLSVATGVGMLALLGLDAETGVIMLVYLRFAIRERLERDGAMTREGLCEAIVEGAALRLRPKLMTASCILFGLVPLLFSHGSGSDVMQRVAAPMVGGVISSFALELFVYPVLVYLREQRALARSG